MANLTVRQFDRGWLPSADADHAPDDSFLRMDNCVLDELGVLTVRRGATIINTAGTPYADLDVHSLYISLLASTMHVMAGAGDKVYADHVAFPTTFDGTGDISFASTLGQIFFARGTIKKKWDGTTLRNWGIAAPTLAPTVAALTLNNAVFASCDTAESPAFVANEGTITVTFPTGFDGVANGSIELTPAATGRAVITKTFAAETNFYQIAPGNADLGGADADMFSFHVYLAAPEELEFVTVQISVNGSSTDPFDVDYYTYTWNANDPELPLSLTSDELVSALADLTRRGETPIDQADLARIQQIRAGLATTLTPGTAFRKDKAVWSTLRIPRARFVRVGSTAGKDWRTVKAVKLIYKATAAATGKVRFDNLVIYQGRDGKTLGGRYRVKIRYARSFGNYTEKSPPSIASGVVNLQGEGMTITIPGAATAVKDPQADKVWVYIYGGALDRYYRIPAEIFVGNETEEPPGMWIDEFETLTTGSLDADDDIRFITFGFGVGEPGEFTPGNDFTFNITASEIELVTLNDFLKPIDALPPDNIVDMEGPHYDRLLALTDKFLKISRQLDPGSFNDNQAIEIGDGAVAETPYWVRKAAGGAYIGTSKDIYRLDGKLLENPDGSIDSLLVPLNIAFPPVDRMVAQEGNVIIYRASDGLRILSGDGSTAIRGDADLLWRGYTRHGVSPLNTSTGRFRAAMSNNILTHVAPEGASDTSSPVLHKFDFTKQRWYRHPYADPAWRSMVRGPDGLIYAGDSEGRVWKLDTGSADNSAAIDVTLWSPLYEFGTHLNRKELQDAVLTGDTASASGALALHLDGSATPALTQAFQMSGEQDFSFPAERLEGLTAFRRLQYRLTGAFETFKLHALNMAARVLPQLRMFVDTGFLDFGQGVEHVWLRELRLKMRAGSNVSLSIYAQDELLGTETVTVAAGVTDIYRIPLDPHVYHGRQLRIAIRALGNPGTDESGFEAYWLEARRRLTGLKSQKERTMVMFDGDRAAV